VAVTVFCEKELVLQLFAKQQHTTLSKNVVFCAKCEDFQCSTSGCFGCSHSPNETAQFR